MSDNQSKFRTNKLSVFLIKQGITKPIKPNLNYQLVNIDNVGVLHYSRGEVETPDWVQKFFLSDSALNIDDFNTAQTKAVLLVKVKYNDVNRLFALTFGAGRFMIIEDAIEERFGLKTTLNSLEPSSIRSIEKKTLDVNPKLSVEQISKEATVADFAIDIERDIVNSITGKSVDSVFTSTITGKDSFHASSKVDIRNIKPFLIRCLDLYSSDAYKEKFEWIDFIQEVKNSSIIEGLNKQLVKEIQAKGSNVWLTVPEIIDWSTISGYRFSNSQDDDLYEELLIEDYLKYIGGKSKVSIEIIKDSTVTLWNDTECRYSWKLYKCLNAQLFIIDKKTKEEKGYLLDNGNWYQIESNFLNEVTKTFDSIPKSKLPLPNYSHKDEEAYNEDVASKLDAFKADKNLISHGRGHSKIEFGDVLTQNRSLLFVKIYNSSASMSHLFAQGFVAAELLLHDGAFRDKLKKKMPSPFRELIPSSAEEVLAKNFELIYVIITNKKKHDLPFFSLVNLRNYYVRLRSYGYKVKVQFVSA